MSESIIDIEHHQEVLELERDKEELKRDKAKWRVRRRLAVSAFTFDLCMIVALLIIASTCSSDVVKNVSEFSSIIITILGCHSSIILLYIGAVTYSDVKKS